MPVYRLHGFRWPRGGQGPEGQPSIRVHIVLANLDEAAAEYIQQRRTSRLILDSFKHGFPELMAHLPNLRLIEQYDPEDVGDQAVSQPYAYVADEVISLQDSVRPRKSLSEKIELPDGLGVPKITPEASNALSELRDKIAPGAEICWYHVYNGDPERYYPGSEMDDLEDRLSLVSTNSMKEPPQSPNEKVPQLKKKRSFWRRGK